MYSTVPPWLQPQLPLIDAVTGAPDPAFPPDGSEVVWHRAASQSPFTMWAPLWAAYRMPGLPHSLSMGKYSTFFPPCQWGLPPAKKGFFRKKRGKKVYHNSKTSVVYRRLHISATYVNTCNQFHQISWVRRGKSCIFRQNVYIKIIQKIGQKLSKYGILEERLDFWQFFVIIPMLSFICTAFVTF